MKPIAFAALAAFTAASTASHCAYAQSGDPINIGHIAPTSGPVATVGLRQLSTSQWWEREVNAKGGIKGRPIKVHHCNDEGSPEKAVTCARDLLSRGVVLLINSSVTGPIRAVMPLIKNGPVMLTPSPNILPDPGSYVFQTSPSDVDLTRVIADFMKRNDVNGLGMVAATDASGEVGVESAKAVFPGAGIKYNLARIDLRANDASIQLASVAKNDVKVIYSTYTGAGAATVVKSYANLGLTQPLIVSYGNISDAFVALIKNDLPQRLLGTGVRGMVPELLPAGPGRDHVMYFAKSYQDWKGERIDQINLNALTLVDTAEQVLRNVSNPADAAAVKAYLEKTPIASFQMIRFTPQNHVGLSLGDIAMLELKGGRWVEAGPLR